MAPAGVGVAELWPPPAGLMPDISIGQAIVIVGLVFAYLIYVIVRA